MVRIETQDVDRLRRKIDRAFRSQPDDKADLEKSILPLLAELARRARPESDHWIFAHRHLAEFAVEHDPWRASMFARRVVTVDPLDDGAWAILGLAQSLMGNHRFAAKAYERALTLAPHNPWYAHNLGHLYDVGLDRPEDAMPLLARASEAETGEADIAASYAHALARCGHLSQAKRVLRPAIRRRATAEQAALWRWLESGAPGALAHRSGADDTANGTETPRDRPSSSPPSLPPPPPSSAKSSDKRQKKRKNRRRSTAEKVTSSKSGRNKVGRS